MKLFQKKVIEQPKFTKKTGWRDYIEVYKMTFIAIAIGYTLVSFALGFYGKQIKIVGSNDAVWTSPVVEAKIK